ncbi:hypothetical protein PR048_018520 [Dryococelus australis]|uniref:Uncharacterized protein n=1 Tax=Dryococelus australis TaxID=614101 RepID=A0ABQ9HCH6_9NEOP|nr:hypothetical protein PR048_018520 [Dryococelus australis]
MTKQSRSSQVLLDMARVWKQEYSTPFVAEGRLVAVENRHGRWRVTSKGLDITYGQNMVAAVLSASRPYQLCQFVMYFTRTAIPSDGGVDNFRLCQRATLTFEHRPSGQSG